MPLCSVRGGAFSFLARRGEGSRTSPRHHVSTYCLRLPAVRGLQAVKAMDEFPELMQHHIMLLG